MKNRLDNPADSVALAVIGAPYGIRGWVWLSRVTENIDDLLQHNPYRCSAGAGRSEQVLEIIKVERRNKKVCAQFRDVDDRDAAAELRGLELAVTVSDLPELPAGEYYWIQLQGCQVINSCGTVLGVIDEFQETGREDMMRVRDGERDLLIPFAMGRVISNIDWDTRSVHVDWEVDWS